MPATEKTTAVPLLRGNKVSYRSRPPLAWRSLVVAVPALGTYHITPMGPGQLTVGANLPAPGSWNGDTPGAVKDGFEYCMAANIARRAILDRMAVVTAKARGADPTKVPYFTP